MGAISIKINMKNKKAFLLILVMTFLISMVSGITQEKAIIEDPDRETIDALLKKGNEYSRLAQFPQALKSYNQALEISRRIGDEKREAASLNGNGNVYYYLDRYTEALENLQTSLEISRRIGYETGEAKALNKLGNVYGILGQQTKALENLQNALEISRRLGNEGREANLLMQSGKDEDTDASISLKKLLGLSLFSYEDVLKNCQAYEVDEDGDRKYDYISLVDIETKKEKYRYVKEFETELEPGKIQIVNVLFMDINEDAEMDVMYWDYEMDNVFDSIMLDIDFDGILDIIGIDSDKKDICSLVPRNSSRVPSTRIASWSLKTSLMNSLTYSSSSLRLKSSTFTIILQVFWSIM